MRNISSWILWSSSLFVKYLLYIYTIITMNVVACVYMQASYDGIVTLFLSAPKRNYKWTFFNDSYIPRHLYIACAFIAYVFACGFYHFFEVENSERKEKSISSWWERKKLIIYTKFWIINVWVSSSSSKSSCNVNICMGNSLYANRHVRSELRGENYGKYSTELNFCAFIMRLCGEASNLFLLVA